MSIVADAFGIATASIRVRDLFAQIRSEKYKTRIENIRAVYIRAKEEGRDPKLAVRELRKNCRAHFGVESSILAKRTFPLQKNCCGIPGFCAPTWTISPSTNYRGSGRP